jgi:hypothetical protein
MRVVYPEEFFHDGRGPTLVAVHLAPHSAHLIAIDYRSPDSVDRPVPVQHLLFAHAQTFMFTPEEVENYAANAVDWSQTQSGALVSLGRSPWLESFSPMHLGKCEHFRAMFYDEFLDVVCEGVVIKSGAYAGGL